MTHQFIICAYHYSPYLETCIQSLLAQTAQSVICIATSTPNDKVSALAAKYDLPVIVHDGGSIAADWNGAMQAADADLVTLAHQDDCYDSEYSRRIQASAESAVANGERPQILFTDYYEIRGDKREQANRNLNIKERLLIIGTHNDADLGAMIVCARI